MTGFVKFPLPLYSLCLSLSLAESRVLSMIVRQTLGWRKSWDAISLSQFQRGIGREPGTGMSRTQIVAAIRRLEAATVIRVQRRKADVGHALTTLYGLAEQYLDSPAVELSREQLSGLGRNGVVPVSHQGGSEKTSPTKDRSFTKDASTSTSNHRLNTHDDALLTHQKETVIVEKVTEHAPMPDPPLATRASDAKCPETPEPIATQAKTEPTAEKAPDRGAAASTPLVSNLLTLGLTQRVARQLIEAYSPENVRAALENLPYRKARNPAGYLISELKAGDYAAPEARMRRTRALALRPHVQEVEKAQAAAVSDAERMEAIIAQLDEATRTELWRQARRKCLRFGRSAISDDSPLLQAQFELLVSAQVAAPSTDAERVGVAQGNARAA